MISALLYLYFVGWLNAYRQKLLRLKQPRYFAGAVAGAAYCYFFFLRRLVGVGLPLPGANALSAQNVAGFEVVAAAILLVYLAGLWIFPTGRAALKFSEAEVAFLFSAPISRRRLIHFKLFGSQIKILFSAAFFAFISHRWTAFGSSYFIQWVGWWLVLSFINLHSIGAAFTRDRLLEAGINPLRRRAYAAGFLLFLLGVTWIWIRRNAPTWAEASDLTALSDLFRRILTAPPLGWILAPLRLVVRPGLASTAALFFRQLAPALALLGLEYIWILKAEGAFEEASLATAQRRTALVAALQAGKFRTTGPKSPQAEPFPLRPIGPRPVAFLWKSLIGLGKFSYPRVWFIGATVAIVGLNWLTHDPARRSMVQIIGVISTICAFYALAFSPALVRRSSQRLIEHIDLMKAYPLPGWEIVVGELLCPIAIVTALEWILISLLTIAAEHGGPARFAAPALATSTAIGTALVIPFLVALLFALNVAGVLLFPAWTATSPSAGGGIDRMGQRLIFFAGYLVIALLALVPAAGCGALIFFSFKYVLENAALGALLAGVCAALILAGECSVTFWWLGQRYEQFDLSAELPK